MFKIIKQALYKIFVNVLGRDPIKLEKPNTFTDGKNQIKKASIQSKSYYSQFNIYMFVSVHVSGITKRISVLGETIAF